MEMSTEDFGLSDEPPYLTGPTGRSEGEALRAGIPVGLNKTVFVDFADQIEAFMPVIFNALVKNLKDS